MRSVFVAFVLLIGGLANTSYAQPANDANTSEDMRRWSPQKLAQHLTMLLSRDEDFRWEDDYEACLSEILRRNAEGSATLLKGRHQHLMGRKIPVLGDGEPGDPGVLFNLELLTTLRRLQHRPDPLVISIDGDDGPIEATPLALPAIKVALVNSGPKAIPALIDALKDESLSRRRRSWVLSLLYSATGEHDPRRHSVFGTYRHLQGPWRVMGGRPGEANGGFALGATGWASGGEIDADKQKALSQTWINWTAKSIRVKWRPRP